MADDSPGKVQALRAMFSEKNQPLMGMMPPGGLLSNKPWRPLTNSVEDVKTLKERPISEQKAPVQASTKVFPFSSKSSSFLNGESHTNGFTEKSLDKVLLKPSVGPKPSYLISQVRTNSSANVDSDCADTTNNTQNGGENLRCRTFSDGQRSQAKSKAFGETIASFMFTSEHNNNKENDKTMTDSANKKVAPPPIPKPRTSQIKIASQKHTELMNFYNSQSNGVLSKCDLESSCCNLISSDNYVCKSNCNFRRKELPSIDKLGQPPLKPLKPQHLKLPAKYGLAQSNVLLPDATNSQSNQNMPPALPQKPVVPLRPAYPCPPRPQTPPPLPPVSVPVIKPPSSLREEIEELYEDTLLGDHKRPVSLIPEYTEEEEQAEELYHDAGEASEEVPIFPVTTTPIKPKNPPPPPHPSEYLQPNIHSSSEELYQDAEEPIQEEFYEEMPCDAAPEEYGVPLYSNNRKEIEKLKREEEKRLRKEQKEREKREKEMEKLRKKFGLTGEEIPIDDGLVKADSRGGKGDLPVKKGETVLILRMEGNPSGRWLVKNEKGKIGYVELTNIEVDPLSVKSVMTIRRLSVISAGEELYSEARSEEEAIYEVTY